MLKMIYYLKWLHFIFVLLLKFLFWHFSFWRKFTSYNVLLHFQVYNQAVLCYISCFPLKHALIIYYAVTTQHKIKKKVRVSFGNVLCLHCKINTLQPFILSLSSFLGQKEEKMSNKFNIHYFIFKATWNLILHIWDT